MCFDNNNNELVLSVLRIFWIPLLGVTESPTSYAYCLAETRLFPTPFYYFPSSLADLNVNSSSGSFVFKPARLIIDNFPFYMASVVVRVLAVILGLKRSRRLFL